jgi:hypothetical protein
MHHPVVEGRKEGPSTLLSLYTSWFGGVKVWTGGEVREGEGWGGQLGRPALQRSV